MVSRSDCENALRIKEKRERLEGRSLFFSLVILCREARLLHFPNIVGFEEFGEVVVRLLGSDFVKLRIDSFVVGRSVHVTDDSECDREIRSFHHGEFELEGVVLAMSVVNEHVVEGVSVLTNFDYFESKALLHESELVVLAEDEFFAMAHVDGVLLAPFVVVDRFVGTVVEDDAVLKYFANGGTVVLVGSLKNLNGTLSIGGDGTGEEVSARSEAEFSWAERILNRAIRRRLADKSAWGCRGVLSLGESIDAVVEQDHVEVDVASVGVDEVVTSDGESVTVTADLPNSEVRVGDFASCGDGGGTSVDGVHAVGGHVVRQTAGAADAGDDSGVMRSDADFSHGFLKRGEEGVVATTWTPTRLSFFIVLYSIVAHNEKVS